MQFQDRLLAADLSGRPSSPRRLSLRAAMLTMGLLSGATWAGAIYLLRWAL